ncbi:MAG TPA: RNA polymerase sigma factor [Chloroflexota bacterium]|nr:RNA polymerase sigma factor [Chloroflexota bacterium]
MDVVTALGADLDGAFPGVVETYQDSLYRFALRLSGNSQDAEETAQEAFVRAYRWLKSHQASLADLALKPWLYQVTLNVFRNGVRRPRPPTASLDDARELAGDGRVEPPAVAERTESRAELARVLAGLPRRYREAVVLRHVEELSYTEMAAVLERPEGTIKSDVHRGLGLLRAALAPAREEMLA